ncbi:MAG TPA: metalloregulator ArsR/SmtB family transcription factor [Burkholderiaceae bacterium]|nr:metalloregulator ArsR/SmtB family transcription factor [Burkholderiaceae bacterium]
MLMPSDAEHRLDAAFSALADPTRRAILARLSTGEAVVGELVQPFGISGPAISRHLRVLERAGLIEREVRGPWRVCRLQAQGLKAAHDWLSGYRDFWEASLDRLVDLLEQPAPQPVENEQHDPADSAVSRRSTRRTSTRPLRPVKRKP